MNSAYLHKKLYEGNVSLSKGRTCQACPADIDMQKENLLILYRCIRDHLVWKRYTKLLLR